MHKQTFKKKIRQSHQKKKSGEMKDAETWFVAPVFLKYISILSKHLLCNVTITNTMT